MFRLFLLVFFFSFSQAAHAELFHVRELSLLVKQFAPNATNPFIEHSGLERELDKEMSLIWNIDIYDPMFYWDNKIWSLIDRPGKDKRSRQYRTIGWNFRIGAHLSENFDLEYEHFSRHLMDAKYPDVRYYIEDSLNLRIKFLTN